MFGKPNDNLEMPSNPSGSDLLHWLKEISPTGKATDAIKYLRNKSWIEGFVEGFVTGVKTTLQWIGGLFGKIFIRK